MAKYKYIDKLGQEQTIEANNPNEAISNSSANRAGNSGVMTIADVYGEAGVSPTAPTGQPKFNLPDPDGYDEGKAASDYLNDNPVDEDSIRSKTLGLFQKEIDAVNQIYAQQLRDATQQGLGRLGSTSAILGRSGNIGSPGGESVFKDVENQNREINASIQAEQSAKIGAIMGTARKEAAAEIAAKRAAQQQGLESYLGYLSSAADRKKGNLAKLSASLVSQGIDPSVLSEEEIDDIAKSYGVSKNDILASYTTSKKSEDERLAAKDLENQKIQADIAKGKLVELSEGAVLYNTETGETFKNPKTYKADTDANGVTLTAKQKSQKDSLNSVVSQLRNYKSMVDAMTSSTFGGINLTGTDASSLRTAKAALEFAIAEAVGTGALQSADRDVVRDIIPDPTSFKGGLGQAVRGGKQGSLDSIDEAERIFTARLNTIESGSSVPVEPSAGVKSASTVTIRTPDGRVGTIPQANLEAAIKAGAKVVQ